MDNRYRLKTDIVYTVHMKKKEIAKPMIVRFYEVERKAIKKYAKKNKMSQAEAVREAIRYALVIHI